MGGDDGFSVKNGPMLVKILGGICSEKANPAVLGALLGKPGVIQ